MQYPPPSFKLFSASPTGYIKDVTDQRSGDVADATLREYVSGQKVFGRYTLLKILGRGGMGIVWLARDEELEREVALKFLPDIVVHDHSFLDELKRETRRSLELTHRNIVRIHDFVFNESSACISMEYIDGDTLANLRAEKEQKVFEPNELSGWTSQLCDALDYAHNHAKIIHRDLKPANLMVNKKGDLKISDFGIAGSLGDTVSRVTMEQSRSGTLVYMSPQQLDGERGTHLDDVYSLGATLYELLTSKPPFYSGNIDRQIHERVAPSMTERRKELDIEPALVPPVWEDAVAACLAKDPAKRLQSAGEVANRLQAGERMTGKITETSLKGSKKYILIPVTLAALCLIAIAAWYFGVSKRAEKQRTQPVAQTEPATGAATGPALATFPEKSIAVLPFENLSKDEENAFFASGVQDEILTNLAKIADLKVISRMSAMKYKSGVERNLREIAKTLGVSHVVEGSVQRAAGRVRVTAQLIDARSDAHLWAEHYDRDFADVFAIQSEIAQQIASQLHSKLSPAEKAAIAERPTRDLKAYELYTQANAINVWDDWQGAEKSMDRKVELLEKATQRDPSFTLAYCALAKTQCDLAENLGSAHLESAKKAADSALRLRPDLGEVHRELARYYYSANDFGRAYEELIVARRTLPNDSETFRIGAEIDRHQNRWGDALANFQKASELDPRNDEVTYHLGVLCREMRRYNEWEQLVTKDAANHPGPDPWSQMGLAEIKLDKGDPVAAQALLSEVPLDFSPTSEIWETRFTAALYLHDYDAANRVIAATPETFASDAFDGQPPESWSDCLIARFSGDKKQAAAVFAAAQKKLDSTWADKTKNWLYFVRLARLEAGLARKDDAIRDARRALDLMPIAKDAVSGTTAIANLALVYAWSGEPNLGIEQLEILAKLPSGPSYGDLRFNPTWDSLRGDPRFEKIITSLVPK
jgi:serine/threonine protein kinase/predicted Zn-dependent protease